MIIRILTEGQYEVGEHLLDELNGLDDRVEQAVAAGDQGLLGQALEALLSRVRTAGTELPDSALHDSDLILPAADSTLAEVRSLLDESAEGLIPG